MEKRNAVLRTWAGEAGVDLLAENTTLRLELLTARTVAKLAVDALKVEAKTKRGAKIAKELQERLEQNSL